MRDRERGWNQIKCSPVVSGDFGPLVFRINCFRLVFPYIYHHFSLGSRYWATISYSLTDNSRSKIYHDPRYTSFIYRLVMLEYMHGQYYKSPNEYDFVDNECKGCIYITNSAICGCQTNDFNAGEVKENNIDNKVIIFDRSVLLS